MRAEEQLITKAKNSTVTFIPHYENKIVRKILYIVILAILSLIWMTGRNLRWNCHYIIPSLNDFSLFSVNFLSLEAFPGIHLFIK
jgi:hypothetical protein